MQAIKAVKAKGSALLDWYYDSVPPYRLDRMDRLISVLVGCLFFILYLLTCSRQPNIAGDSPELIAGSYSLGIVHPPGYPLYTMAGYLVTHIPVGSVAFRLNCFSALQHAITLALLFAIMMKITRSRTSSCIAASALGLSYLFWFYSLVAEVFPLNDLFAVLLILMAIMVRERSQSGEERRAERLFLIMAFVAGLSLTNHQTIILIFPALLLFCPRTFLAIVRKPRRLLLAVAAFLLGLLPYVYLPLRASQDPYMNFGDPSSFRSFFDTITRKYYGTSSLWKGPNAIHRLDLVFDYANALYKEVFMSGMILGLVGMFQMARKRCADFIPLITAFILSGVVFFMMANVIVTETFYLSTIERFYILPTVVFAVFIAMGIKEILAWLSRLVSASKRHVTLSRGLVPLAALILALAFLIPAIATLGDVDLHEDYFSQSYTDDLLGDMETGAVVFCAGDPPIELIDEYYTVINDYHGEVITLSWSFFGQQWYMDGLRKWRPELNLPEDIESYTPEDEAFEQYRARLAYRLILDNPQIPGFYILVKDRDLDAYVTMISHGMAYKILAEDTPVDYDSYYAFLAAYWADIDRRGLDAVSYPGNRREPYMIDVISSYADNAGQQFASVSRFAAAADMYREALGLSATIVTELNLASALDELDMPGSVELLYLDVINNIPPSEPLLWQTVEDLEALLKNEGSP
ncbi:MAG: DUF2723 domain-containing protein [Actinobacteria bacterium]|jgi:hypothetical protein|nr:MAG: DUF2723 domain-containing protein [Actinomycetota bacterium]